MLLYLVRHGQTEANKARILDQEAGPLSEEGRESARKLANRLAHEQIDELMSSDYQRAMETAHIISEKLKLKIVQNKLAREQRIPSSMVGKPQDNGPFVKEYGLQVNQHVHDPKWHFEDEENTAELLARARAFLDDISKLKIDHVCVVTHRGLLRYLAAAVLLGDSAKPEVVRIKFRPKIDHSNTAISVFEYTKEKGWCLITWNDQA